MTLVTYNPAQANLTDGLNLANNLSGKQGEQLGADLHGKWYNANVRRNLYTFLVRNVTLGVVSPAGQGTTGTNGLTSVFVLSNPAGSNVLAEIVSTTVTHSSATTVAGDLGWFVMPVSGTQSAIATTPATFTKAVTGATYFSTRVGDVPSGQVIPYTAMTFTTTGGGLITFQVDCVGTIGGTTDTSTNVLDKQHEGRLIVPPGQTILFGGNGLCASANLQVVWAEWPFA